MIKFSFKIPYRESKKTQSFISKLSLNYEKYKKLNANSKKKKI